jgi:hypothetical protein
VSDQKVIINTGKSRYRLTDRTCFTFREATFTFREATSASTGVSS